MYVEGCTSKSSQNKSMDSANSTRSHERRHRSRSSESGEERRLRRRRTGREADNIGKGGIGCKEEYEKRGSRYENENDRYEDRDRKRRRSRSPAYEPSRRHHDDRDSKHRSRRERSPDYSRDSGSKYNSRDDRLQDARKPGESSMGRVNSRKNKGSLPSQAAAFGKDKPTAPVTEGEVPEMQKPNFAVTGLLAAASNSVAAADGTSVVLKYHEPPEARKPPAKNIWNLFVFKGDQIVETIKLGLRSCWLIGREMAVVDMPAEHPSISKQHAVIQFRYIEKKNEYGDKVGKVRPYLIDLESANKTMLNKEEVPSSRYLELRDKDMIQFGHSTREYVVLLSPK
ncbi:SMAD/FHA domain-containing protein [Calycina marina]|uniref:SMAD/FHA domain-containing protein n=1 Tax=Calycina marina TaxID=1763456 RepID=A0A9P7Z2L2_9HELO|nr:SMAD/FHA domain-containing protein [Calycina marina]